MPNARIPDRIGVPGDDETHVWTARLSQVSATLPALERLLSLDEKQTAGRFLRPGDRSRYIAAHGILRQLLGQYQSVAPAGLAFEKNAFGKPELAPRAAQPPLTFNLAHSDDVIVCVVALGRRVGVDVEAIRDDLDVMDMAASQFSPAEAEALRAVPPSARIAAFFRCWTRKEAYVKARGEGLGFPLSHFTVSFDADEPPGLQWVLDDPSAPAQWSVFDFTPTPGYAGAVVVEGRPVRPLYRPFLPSR